MTKVIFSSVLSALSTGAGALIILFIHQSITHRWKDVLLAFSAGIMMAASTIGLIPEAMKYGGFAALFVGICLGVWTLTLLEKNIPHIDLQHNKTGIQFDEKALLIISAITLHNIPEGLSVGVSYASQEGDTGNLIALGLDFKMRRKASLLHYF